MSIFKNTKKTFCLFLCMLLFPSFSFALDFNQSDMKAMVKDALSSNNNSGGTQKNLVDEEYLKLEKVTSPFVNKTFEICINKDSVEYKLGKYKVICPYTGKEFFIGAENKKESNKKNLVSKKVRSPFTGQIFTAQIDMDAILVDNSSSTTLICPYTGKSFRFNLEPILDKEDDSGREQSGFIMILDPDNNQYFKVLSDMGKFPLEVTSPYSGKTIKLPKTGEKSEDFSNIEEIFNNKLLKNRKFQKIKQFGYELFPVNVDAVEKKTPSGNDNQTNSGLTLSNIKDDPLLDNAKKLMGKMSSGGSSDNKGSFESTSFAPITSVPVSPDYILGPDDTIVVNIWGKVQQTVNVTIDRDGKIILPEAGAVYLWGQTFEEAKKLITNALNNYYTNINIDITMGKLRTIRVFIMGNAKRPGGYILSSRATAFHAVFNALGPNKNGSLRNITIKHKDDKIETIDLYDLFLYGNKSKDISLESDDVVFINPIGETAGITGEVKNPAIYELKEPILIKDFIALAGGLLSIANKSKINVIRIENNKQIFLDIDESKMDSFFVKGGDLVLVPPIEDLQRSYITVEGSIYSPGDYEFKNNLTLGEVIEKSGGFLPDACLKQVEVIRKSKGSTDEIYALNFADEKSKEYAKKFELKEWDVCNVYDNKNIAISSKVEIKGPVQNPGQYPFLSNMKIADLIFKAGGITVPAENIIAELYVQDAEGNSNIYKFNVKDIYDNLLNEDFNKKLIAGNLLIIRSKKMLINSKRVITLEGEVKYPGEYLILEGDRISTIIERAGGYTDKAFLRGALFTRKALKEQQQEMAKKLMDEQFKDMLREEAVLIEGSNSGESSADTRKATLTKREELLNLISNSKVIGRMIVKLYSDPSFTGSRYDIALDDGDYLQIPTMPSTVQVVGSVYNPCSILFEPHRGVNYYIQKIGGYTKYADKKHVYIIKMNGEVVSNFVGIDVMEVGDTIVVPEKFEYVVPAGVIFRDTIDMLYKVALGAAVVKSLK